MKLNLINFIAFQIIWFACVLGAANNLPWLGVVTALTAMLWHFSQANNKKNELCLIVIAMILGGALDQTMLSLKLIEYQHIGNYFNNTLPPIVPFWIIALWVGFASTLNVSLRWLREKKVISILFGLIGGPLAYMSAQKLGAVSLTSQTSLIALGIAWAIATPILLEISTKFDGFKARQP